MFRLDNEKEKSYQQDMKILQDKEKRCLLSTSPQCQEDKSSPRDISAWRTLCRSEDNSSLLCTADSPPPIEGPLKMSCGLEGIGWEKCYLQDNSGQEDTDRS